MLIRCEMLKKLANAFIEVAKEENLPVNITMGRSYTDSGGSRQVGIILEFDSWNSKIINCYCHERYTHEPKNDEEMQKAIFDF